MADFTFLEFHLHGDVKSGGSGGSSILPRSSGEGDGETEVEFEPNVNEESEDGSMGTRVLVGLLFLAFTAAIVRVLRDRGESQTELEEFEEVAPEP
jgi:hypothetical protein